MPNDSVAALSAELKELHKVMARMADRLQEARGKAAVLDVRVDELTRRIEGLERSRTAMRKDLAETAGDLRALQARMGGARAVLREWLPWLLALFSTAAALYGRITGHQDPRP